MTTPRLRPELHATPAEEQGIKFFDVSDPRSGVKMRLYDFEWLLASQMDGRRPLDEISRWAKGALHVDVSTTHLEEFGRKLGELGFFAESSNQSAPELPPAPGRLGGPKEDSRDQDVSIDVDEPEPVDPEPAESFADDFDTTIRPTPLAAIEASRRRDDEPTAEATVAMKPKQPAPPQREPSTVLPPLPIAAEDAAPEKRSGSGGMIGLLLVLLAIGAIAYYVTYIAPSGAKVSVTVAKPSEVVRVYDAGAKLDKASAKSLSFGEAGKVVDVVAAGTEVKAGTPLATLDGYSKMAGQIAEIKGRLEYYQKAVDAAGASESAKKSAEGKVAEKKAALDEAEARVGKLRLVATGPGVVDKVMVTAGANVKADEPALTLNDQRMMAVFKLPADAAAIKAGDDVSVQRVGGGPTASGKAVKIEDGSLSVELGEDAGAVGGEVRLVKSRLPGVITLPVTAVVPKAGGDVVYTLADGTVHEKKVTVADRTATEVYVSGGVAAGDSVVSAGGAALKDGEKAAVAQ